MSRPLRASMALVTSIGLLAVPAAATAAPPANDDIASPIVISEVPFAVSLDASEATADPGDMECAGGQTNPTVWFSFTPSEDGLHGVATWGSDYDTTLAIGVMGADGLEILDCNDDAGSTTSAIVEEMVAGVEYRIMVGSCCDGAGGRLELQLVQDPEVGSEPFQLPPDLTAFLAQRPRGDAGPLWRDATAGTIGETAEWTNKVEVADIDGDGLLDILHANGGDYDSPGPLARPAVFLNAGPGAPFTDATSEVFGDATYHARVIKARDVTGDGVLDLLVGSTYGTQSHLLRGLGGGAFEDVTEMLLPQLTLSVGDLEVGDVDGDGDTDIVLADWGPGNPMGNPGAPVRLWRNTGEGWVADDGAMPETPIQFSWDIELADVDGDWDLDVLVSCKQCETSRIYLNDGTGAFSDGTAAAFPAASNNYEFEVMDLDGDGAPDLLTINDGPGWAERALRNDRTGSFSDVSAEWLPPDQNPGFDDNVIVVLDADSDGDADFIVGSLDGPDRLLINDGSGRFTADPSVFDGPDTPGTLGLALGDLDGDGRLDVVQGQGELADPDLVFLATEAMSTDTAGPSIDAVAVVAAEDDGSYRVFGRIHDRKTPVVPHDFGSVTVRLAGQGPGSAVPMEWYGEALWRAVIESRAPITAADVTVCAVDRAGNESCSDPG